jgi:hypothetical protein
MPDIRHIRSRQDILPRHGTIAFRTAQLGLLPERSFQR